MRSRDKPYVFLSYTGRDGVKESLARPTQWFLRHVLGVDCFLDDGGDIRPGQDKMEFVVLPAYQCTHALLIFSPRFRTRHFCVMGVNTFLGRWQRKDGLQISPALWGVDNVDDCQIQVSD